LGGFSVKDDDTFCDDILSKLAFDLMVQRGLKDSDERRIISNEVMERRIKTWQIKRESGTE
jgi:hypothetical protein